MSKSTTRALISSLSGAVLCLSIVASNVSMAGPGPHHKMDRAEMIAERLGLDATQKSSVEAIFENNRPVMKQIRDRTRANFKALRELDPSNPQYTTQVQGLADEAGVLARERVLNRAQLRAELAVVLSPEQMEAMKEWKHKRKRHGHPGGFGGPGRNS